MLYTCTRRNIRLARCLLLFLPHNLLRSFVAIAIDTREPSTDHIPTIHSILSTGGQRVRSVAHAERSLQSYTINLVCR